MARGPVKARTQPRTTPKGPPNQKKARKYCTYRILPDEYEDMITLPRLSASTPTVHATMLALVPLVRELNLPDIRKIKRRAIALDIPDALKAEIDKVIEETGQPFITVLLSAARLYREKINEQEKQTPKTAG